MQNCIEYLIFLIWNGDINILAMQDIQVLESEKNNSNSFLYKVFSQKEQLSKQNNFRDFLFFLYIHQYYHSEIHYFLLADSD